MKIHYVLKENSIKPNDPTPMVTYLRNFGIQKPESFIGKIDPDDEISPTKLINIEQAIKRLKYCFENNEKVFLQVDSDADGYTSAAIFYLYFKERYPNAKIEWRLHKGKEHGAILDTIPQDTDVVVLPDSGSMQVVEQKALAEKGMAVVVLDHHEVDEYFEHENVIIVNNQMSPDFDNKFLSGAGVTFKTVQLYDTTFFDGKLYSDFYDLAALGILSDMMDVRNLDNNYIIRRGLEKIKSPLFKAIMDKQIYGIKNPNKPTKTEVVFYVTPLINGTIRAGTDDEKKLLFRGFIKDVTELLDEGAIITKSGFYAHIAKLAANIKGRQDSRKRACVPFLVENIIAKGMDKNKIIVAITSEDDAITVPQNITGLVAMELSKYFNKPTLVLRPRRNEDGIMTYSGSGRGKKSEGFDSLREVVKNADGALFAAGHPNAHGAGIEASKLDDFIADTNETLKDVNFEVKHEVDAIVNITNVEQYYNALYQFGENEFIYGHGLPQPKIAVEMNYTQNNSKVMGKKLNSCRFSCGRLSCVLFKNDEVADTITKSLNGKVKMVGRVNMNEWGGAKNPQIIIDECEATPSDTGWLF